MGEYCKVIEVVLLCLEQSEEYREEEKQSLDVGKQKTLGSGAVIVSKHNKREFNKLSVCIKVICKVDLDRRGSSYRKVKSVV